MVKSPVGAFAKLPAMYRVASNEKEPPSKSGVHAVALVALKNVSVLPFPDMSGTSTVPLASVFAVTLYELPS